MSQLFASGTQSIGVSARYDGEVSEPLVGRQGSPNHLFNGSHLLITIVKQTKNSCAYFNTKEKEGG